MSDPWGALWPKLPLVAWPCHGSYRSIAVPSRGQAVRGHSSRQPMIDRRLFLVSCAAVAGAASAEPPKLLSEGEPVVPNGRQYLLRSGETGCEYLVRVAEPQKQPPEGQKAGVVYVLDGNWYFGLATDVVRMLPVGTTTPPVFVVAVGYPVTAYDDVVENRERDYTFQPFSDRPSTGGGGEAFARFLVDDLRAFIQQRYDVDRTQRYVAGQSLGGIFVTNLLLRRPESFSGYLIGSPSTWQDPTTLPAARLFSAGGGRRVFVGVGAEESPNMQRGVAGLVASLSRPEAGLKLLSRQFANQHHMSMYGTFFSEGMRYVLEGHGDPSLGCADVGCLQVR